MMQLSELRHIWQESHPESMISGCGKEEITMLLRSRSADLKKQVLKRLTTEIRTYLMIGLFLLCTLLVKQFSSARAFLLGLCALLVVVPALGALAYKEYRLRTLPMSGSLRESISALIRAIDSTARLYLFAYVASIGLSLGLIEILLVWSRGWNMLTIILVPIGVAFIGWSYLSGRRYASRMFRAYRSDLVHTLDDLESV
jgi:hypothetical protein